MGDKSAQNVLDNIEASKARPLTRVLFALGIRYVGYQTAELLARAFGSMDRLRAASLEEILAVEGIGPKIAESVLRLVPRARRPERGHRSTSWRRQASTCPRRRPTRGGPLAGLTIVVTGRLERHSRTQIEQRIKDLGGTRRRLGVQEDELPARRRGRGLETGQSAEARHADPGRGRLRDPGRRAFAGAEPELMAGPTVSTSDTRCDWARGDPLDAGLPRPRMGRAAARRPRAVRAADARRRAGWSELDARVLRRREGYRARSPGSTSQRVAGFGEADSARLMADAGIIRNRQKLISTARQRAGCARDSARAGLVRHVRVALRRPHAAGQRAADAWPTCQPRRAESVALSKALRQRGFGFVGPTICYAFMQAAGLVNDHLVACPRHARAELMHARRGQPDSCAQAAA